MYFWAKIEQKKADLSTVFLKKQQKAYFLGIKCFFRRRNPL